MGIMENIANELTVNGCKKELNMNLKKMGMLQAIAVGCALLVMGGASVLGADALTPETKAKIKALEEASGKVYVRWSPWTVQPMAKYNDLKPDAELEKMRVDYLNLLQEILTLDPNRLATHNDLGEAYLCEGHADLAIPHFEAVLKVQKLTEAEKGNALIGLADAALLKNDKAAAVRYLKELVACGYKPDNNRQNGPNPTMQAQQALYYLDGDGSPKIDDFKLPFYTGAKVFPTAQEAVYKDEFVPLKRVNLVLGKELKASDARVKLLRQKLARFGIESDITNAPQQQSKAGDFIIKINADDKLVPPENPQGYALSVTKSGAIVSGRDKLGTTWGVVSLIQLIDQAKKAIRVCEIHDWPALKNRMSQGQSGPGNLEHTLFTKMNLFRGNTPFSEGRSPLRRMIVNTASEWYAAFGLDFYTTIRSYTMGSGFPLTSERTFALHKEILSEMAAHGGSVYFPYDDARFPLHPEDLKKSGAGANQDAKYLDRLFKAIRKDYPDFRMVFCPPFYFGPDGPARYPEPRDEYLKSIARDLDPAVEVFWTGPRVKGFEKRPDQVKWITDLIGRKPAVSQNAPGRHNLYNYLTDEMPYWSTWHYDGFVNDIGLFDVNTSVTAGPTVIATLADYLWNPKGYDSRRSIRESVAMLYGEKMFGILNPATEEMAKFDKYPYGASGFTPDSTNDVPELERVAKFAQERYDQAMAYNPESMSNMPGYFGAAVAYMKEAAKKAKNPPDYFKTFAKEIGETLALAVKEVGVDKSKGDMYRSPFECQGSKVTGKSPGRVFDLLYGARSQYRQIRFGFECDPFPAGADYELFLCGLSEPNIGKPNVKIRVSVNGKPVFEGECKFQLKDWSVQKIVIPFPDMKRNNQVLIENIEDSDNIYGPPWVGINYVVIKKT